MNSNPSNATNTSSKRKVSQDTLTLRYGKIRFHLVQNETERVETEGKLERYTIPNSRLKRISC